MANHLWQSTVFAIAAWVVTLAFRRNRAEVRFWLWFAASAKFLIPFAPLIEAGREVQILRRLERRSHISRSIELWCFAGPLEPGVFGIHKPVLLWPRSITDQLSDEQVEAIIAHEICHVARHDNLLASVHMV